MLDKNGRNTLCVVAQPSQVRVLNLEATLGPTFRFPKPPAFHEVVWLRFGAGAMPWRRRMFPTVWSDKR
jgi:hypothetical protein